MPDRGTYYDSDAVKKIAASNIRGHAQFAFAFSLAHGFFSQALLATALRVERTSCTARYPWSIAMLV
jgi:hypothetical protein